MTRKHDKNFLLDQIHLYSITTHAARDKETSRTEHRFQLLAL